MLDVRRWFNPKHYNRLWNVGPPGLLFSVSVVHGLHWAEELFRLKTFSLEGTIFWVLVGLVVVDAITLLYLCFVCFYFYLYCVLLFVFVL